MFPRPVEHEGSLIMSMRCRSLGSVLAVVAATLLWVSLAAAQAGAPAAPAAPGGKIRGKVVSKGGEAVSFANVIVVDTKQGKMTDENGNYVIAGVPAGSHTVKVQSISFGELTQTINVQAGQEAVVNFSFGEEKLVKQFEEIEVRAEKRIDTKSSTTKQNITAEKLRE